MNLKRANQLFQLERYEDALAMYEKIVVDNPSLRTILEFNINLAKIKLSKNPFNSNQVDILATIWLSNDEPIHNILKDSIYLLNLKSFNCKLFAPRPLLENVYDNNSYFQTQAASIYLSRSLIPRGTRLPVSFIESNKETIEYLLNREEQWLATNLNIDSIDSNKDDLIKGIRYWTQVVVNNPPKLMLIWGSSSPVSALLIEICKELSIKYQIIERGLLPGTLIVDDKEQFGYSYSNHLLSSTPLSQSSNLQSINLLQSYLNKTDAVAYKDFNYKSSEDLFTNDRPIILFIGSNDLGSSISLQDSNSHFFNQSEYRSSCEVATDLAKSLPSLNNNAILYIKPHPADKNNYRQLENENIKVLPTNNLHDLIDHSTICCTLCSTAIAICLLKGKPLVTFTSTDVSNLGAAYEIYRKSELISQLRSAFLMTNLSYKQFNIDKYFEFALKYRLYFEANFSEFGNTAINLSDRLANILVTEHKKNEISSCVELDPILKPTYYEVDAKKPSKSVPIDIIIPIYDGFELTKTCIEYALSAASNYDDVNIILVNDCSPNEEISNHLKELSASGISQLTVHTNVANTGFSGAVNIGITLSRPDADIILLNSDALISNSTLHSLQITAYSHSKIATVSPLSTDGGLLTVPTQIQNDCVLTQDEIDNINSNLNPSRTLYSVLLPVNHGACLYIKKTALHIAGSFDEYTFGRGYSEEIDFCLRLRKHGLHNVGCCFTFVQHVGGVSFGSKIDPLKLKNRKIIAEKYPNYFSEVRRFSGELKKSSVFTKVCKLLVACDKV